MPAPTSRRPLVKRRLLKDEAHDAIQEAILDGTFAPGERLDDQALTQWLGVSRSPIREALNMLAAEGLVEIHAQSHTSVVDPDPVQIEQASQVFGVIFENVFLFTAPALDATERATARRLIDRGFETIAREDPRAYIEVMCMRLLDYLIERCPNSFLASMSSAAAPGLAFRGLVAAGVRTPNWELLESGWHRIREALDSGDLAAAERAFAEIFRLPSAEAEWAPARWAARSG